MKDERGDDAPPDLVEELAADARAIMSSELDAFAKIAGLTESVTDKLTALYRAKFPKCCATCGREYPTRESYLEATLALPQKGTMVNKLGVQEYRNCVCGSTLMVWTKDRRDNSPFGVQRRALFDLCLEKVKAVSAEPEPVVRERLRKLFREITERMTAPAPSPARR